MNTRINKAGFLLSIAASVLLISSCQEEKKKTTAEKVPEIETFVLKEQKMATSLKMPGELIAYQQVDLYAKVSSFVKTLKADIGSEVSQGQLLMTLEAPELSSQLAAAESRLKAQEAVYTASKANYDRLFETSKTPGTISKNDLDQAIAKRNADFAQLSAARAAFKEVGNIQNYLEIRAPFSGIISSRNVNLGAFVGPSGKGSEFPLFTLQEQKHLRLAISIPEIYTGYLKTGNEVSFTVRSKPSEVFKAKIIRLSGALDQRLRAERVEIDVFNADKQLLPGMIAEVSIPLPAIKGTYSVPKTAIIDSDEGIYVIKDENNKASRVMVKKGRESDDKVEIFGDLKEGDRIVSKASEEIRPGTVIKP
ncbi:efflux RND transporter periplasmic adaptor subunit [Pedobacter metabolipauper]|uniref:RND family efflux transporter MFP subunit n=1 Tax=Pedobacter metabolipauper TaxID=425513 RepID=A0A4R6STY9_9SPHI|nr:efflux RND transporter periplasmic adaptor subunit [Pedobacter metabolipauper]TDQ07096.1 RND family efflux transporter MFP subunit [Pedobacter metabolipauper]